MPFKSAAQRGYLHAHPEILGKKGLAEWDAASKGQHVPEHVNDDKKPNHYAVARAARKKEQA
jgi:hypothetical protein